MRQVDVAGVATAGVALVLVAKVALEAGESMEAGMEAPAGLVWVVEEPSIEALAGR